VIVIKLILGVLGTENKFQWDHNRSPDVKIWGFLILTQMRKLEMNFNEYH
jgi:hypothetical protein